MTFTQAPEPTNIIWENRQVGLVSRVIRGAMVIGTLAAITVICFSLLVWLMRYNDYAFEKYQNQDCKEVYQIYNPTTLKEYALEEWFEYYRPKIDDPPRKRISAVLDCFCQAQYDEKGVRAGFEIYRLNESGKN